MFNVIATATDYIVVSSSTQASFTINSENNLFTITNQTTNFSVSSTQTSVGVATLSGGFEFNSNFLGEWSTGSYVVNNLVNYEYSLYVLSYTPSLAYNSTIAPSQDPYWRRVVWHEAPFDHLTVTNASLLSGPVTMGRTLSVANTATLASDLSVAGRSTFVGTLTTDWIVTENFVLNGLTYSHDRGSYGQVLFTNGTDQANWTNLGDLQNWSLSEDLYTNGFNIQTGDPIGNDPNPQLTIGSGVNGSFKSSIKFNPVANAATTGTIEVKGDTTFTNAVAVLGNVNISGTATISRGLAITQGLRVGQALAVAQGLTVGGNSVFNAVTATTFTATSQVSVSSAGIKFSDGSLLTSAAGLITTGTFASDIFPGQGIQITTSGTNAVISANTASSSVLGSIKVGEFLSIVTATGVLSVNTTTLAASLATGDLPIASSTVLGGVKIGTGVSINSSTGVLSVATATAAVIGGVKVGTGLSINASTAVLTVATATVAQVGGVKVGDNLTIDPDGTLNAVGQGLNVGGFSLTATSYTNGIDIFATAENTGTGLNISAGSVKLFSSLTNASVITSGITLSANEVSIVKDSKQKMLFGTGNQWSLGTDTSKVNYDGTSVYLRNGLGSNYQYVKLDTNQTEVGTSTNYIRMNATGQYQRSFEHGIEMIKNSGIKLYRNNADLYKVELTATVATFQLNPLTFFKLEDTNEARLSASQTKIGQSASSSTLLVQNIYNYAGTFAPVFPAGIQFGDNSVQVTAFQTSTLYQQFFDFQNPFDP